MKFLWLGAGLPAALITGLLFYSVAVEPYAIERNDLDVTIQALPGAFEGYRILHLSDFEAKEPGRRESRVAEIVRGVRPDLIVVTGDLVRKTMSRAERWEGYRRMAAFLGSLDAPDGVLFVQGHGEMASHINQDGLERILNDAGVKTLWDDVALISRRQSTLAVAGIKVHDYGGKGRWEIGASGLVTLEPGERPAFLEMAAPGSETWTDYDLSGRLRFSSARDWVGLMVRSRLGQGQDRYYMSVRREKMPRLAPTVHGASYNRGQVSNMRELGPGVWHRFRIRVESGPAELRMLARTWADGSEEPSTWDLEYADNSAWRIPSGRPGIYAEGPGVKEFSELVVTRPGGETSRGDWREPAGTDFLLDLRSRVPAGAPMILLSHTPDIFPDARELGIPLVLSGHTQGGQIRLPLIGSIITDTRLGRDYAAGLFVEGASSMFVTRGVGTSRLPMRFLCPPEVAVITLRGAPAR